MNSSHEFKLSPKEYKDILNQITLLNITLKESKVILNEDIKDFKDLKVDISDIVSFKNKKDSLVSIYQKFNFEVFKKNLKSKIIKIEVTFVTNLISEIEFTEDFFEIYKKINLNMNTWPYFREYINDITSKMNVPPFILPFFKI